MSPRKDEWTSSVERSWLSCDFTSSDQLAVDRPAAGPIEPALKAKHWMTNVAIMSIK